MSRSCPMIAFDPVPFAAVAPEIREHFATLTSATDAYFESHVLSSRHYRIVVDGTRVGFASVHEAQLITQFSLRPNYRHFGQVAFANLRTLEQVEAAFVPTCDEFYLAHAIDDYQELAKQACFFALAEDRALPPPANTRLRHATVEDIPMIQDDSGDFFGPLESVIDKGELFVTERDGAVAGFGILEMSALQEATASIGMFTIERYRRESVGRATIALLIEECARRRLHPVAGCWYYNHASKRTLEAAGMFSPTRLLRIAF